ncbi:uncharacterized protein SPSK_08928 [Sporothrix schenckii 1099-18]|uniref:TeaA receptor TeaR n=1 Tax=Sporothrix schenckii 1099-18 TaxID=1397361 RepID=A0A0F2M5I1_SPOSC|nr:uncharacterized protein SPSK_08928 [Sporothrix schenckii 1099-18]KJR84892.1 hypothetical protein SPSK_08928 [Sporothrix schenckii 1099-18]
MATSASTTLTPPTSSHGNGYSWDSSTQHPEFEQASSFSQNGLPKPQSSQHGNVLAHASPNIHSDQFAYEKSATTGEVSTSTLKAADSGLYSYGQENVRQGRPRDASNYLTESALDVHELSRTGTSNDSNKRAAGEARVSELDDISSKWIHRDKLARIENEELQAAGIILPKPRGRSKPRRDTSQDKTASHRRALPEGDTTMEPRSQKNSTGILDGKSIDTPISPWDLRLPDEIAEESYFSSVQNGRGSSRIPVAKLSPAPIALEHIERDTPMPRRRDGSPATEESIAYSKVRARSASMRQDDDGMGLVPTSPFRNMTRSTSDLSPKKISSGGSASTAGLRKSSAPAKNMPPAGRPKTRNGASKDSNMSSTGATRPSTRSGDRELSREISAGAASRQPEGDPPWMISAYRPDPRLPPDQQLLPTVARRLQQEKWEREGKFGTVYDKEFRPLTDEGFLTPPETTEKVVEPARIGGDVSGKPDEWPLKPEAKSSSLHQGRAGSYSTIPKIQDKLNMGPLPSPRSALPNQAESDATPPLSGHNGVDGEAKQGCGCCIVM